MHPDTRYTEVPGEDPGHDIAVYGLTRCEPCKQAREFLSAKGWRYKYVHLERQPQETRQEIKKDFSRAHGRRPVFPVLEIDGEYHFGFNPDAWEQWIAGESQPGG
jgi:glutaredoxin